MGGDVAGSAGLRTTRPASRANRPGIAGRDQPGGRRPSPRSTTARVGRSRISPGEQAVLGGLVGSERPFALFAIAADMAQLHIRTATKVSTVLSLLETDRSSPGQPQLAQLFVAELVVAVCGQPLRFGLESAQTVGGGRVLQPSCASAGMRDRCRSLDLADCRLLSILSTVCVPSWHSMDSRPGAKPPVEPLDGRGRRHELESVLAALTGVGGSRSSFRSGQGSSRPGHYAADLGVGARTAPAGHAARPRHSAIPRAQLGANFLTWRTKP